MNTKDLINYLKKIDTDKILNDTIYKAQISGEFKEISGDIDFSINLNLLLQSLSILAKSKESFDMDLFLDSVSDILRLTSNKSEWDKENELEIKMLNEKVKLFIGDSKENEKDDIIDLQPAQTQEVVIDAASLPPAEFDYSELEMVINDFIEEMDVMIEHLENDLLDIVSADAVKINRIFRCLHTIKGSVGMANLETAQKLAHIAENLFDKIRNNKIQANPNFEDVFLLCNDRFKEIITKVKKRENPLLPVEDLILKLQTLEKTGSILDMEEQVQQEINPQSKSEPASEIEPSKANTQEGKEIKTSALESVPAAVAQETDKEQMSLRVDITKLDNVMNQMGELIIEKIKLEQQHLTCKNFMTDLKSIKVEFSKKKINEQARKQLVFNFIEKFEKFYNNFSNTLDEISRSTMNMQDSVMKIRLVPMSTVLNRFPRLVKDISKKTKKDIDFQIIGAETEIDKGICEMLFNPLLHIIRNSLDHGIEDDKEKRIKAGKPQRGQVLIKAYYKSDKVVIDIIDDGAGIDEDRVVEKAIEKKLITRDEAKAMDKRSKYMIIFQPGFSTAQTVSDLSGRGVGMDVVRSTIEKLKGVVDVTSEKGKGTTISLSLPLTLAIVRILIFNLNNDVLAIPVYNVRETVQIPLKEIHEAHGKPVMNLRGEMIPLIYLSDALGVNDFYTGENISVIIVEVLDKQYGLIVSNFIENREVVIKNLGNLLKKVPFISGAAILGDGEIIPILDTVAVMNSSKESGKRTIFAKTKNSENITAQNTQTRNQQKKVKKKILIVEDSKPYAKQIDELLKSANYETTIAENGKAGIEKLKSKKFDLISTDIVMPVMDGYDFVREARKIKEYELTPIIALTTMKEKVDRIKGFESGMDEYLVKPLNKDEYLAVVKKMIEQE